MKKDFYAGIGLGVLVGTIIGLSIAQVTGIILGALTSLLAAFFGLRGTKEGETGNQVIIGSFSIACVLSILGGLYLRTHNLFSPSLQKEITFYKQASFTDAEIKKIVLFKQFGLVPEGYTYNEAAKDRSVQTVLMASDKSLYLCSAIDNNSSLDEIKNAYDNTGGKYQEVEQKLTAAIKDSTDLRNTLLFFKQLICGQGK